MAHLLKRKIPVKDMPSEFSPHTIKAINRIEEHPNVMGIMYFRSAVENPRNKIMKIISNLLKNFHDEWLVRTTASLNERNPIVDRIMEDDSVEGVVMTNQEGEPVLTNINLMNATTYGTAMRCLGAMTQSSIKDLDPFDEVLILRLHTKKLEIMLAPHPEFNIIVMQNSRVKVKQKENESP